MRIKTRACLTMAISWVGALGMFILLILVVLPNTPKELHPVAWLFLVVFEIFYAIFFLMAWTALDKVNHPERYK